MCVIYSMCNNILSGNKKQYCGDFINIFSPFICSKITENTFQHYTQQSWDSRTQHMLTLHYSELWLHSCECNAASTEKMKISRVSFLLCCVVNGIHCFNKGSYICGYSTVWLWFYWPHVYQLNKHNNLVCVCLCERKMLKPLLEE